MKRRDLKRPASKPDTITCSGKTSKGIRCGRAVFPGARFCWQHAHGLSQRWHSLTRNQSIVFVLGLLGVAGTLLAWLYPDFWKNSQRPYVLSETAFWRNGLAEAVVQFKNSGSVPAYHNRTQIHFYGTTERSDNQKLDWDHMLPAISDSTVPAGGMYNTPALTRLNTISGAENDVLTGKGVAYVYGIVRYKQSPDSGKDYADRFCWMFDASRSQAFFGCPGSVQ
jgi:hypothetical protein